MEGYYIIIEPVVMLRGAPSNGYGQVKLRFSGESRSGMTDWLPIVCDYAGKDYGFWAEPEAGTLAVALMQPESNRGFVLGFLYDKEHRPPVREGEPAKDRIILQTEKHRFEMIDEGDKERIELIGMDGKMSVVLGADGSIKIDNDIEDGTVLINAGKKLTLEANELLLGGKEETNGKAKDIKLEATAAACIDGGKKVFVKGKNIYLDGTTGVTAKGKQVAKQGDKVVGVDTHIVMFPSINGEIPTPMPLPFIGTLKGGLSNNVRIGKDSKKKVAVENSVAQHTNGHIAPPPAVGFQRPPDNQGKVTRGTVPSVKVNKEKVAVVGSKVSSCDDTNAPNRSSVVTAGMAKPAIEAKVGDVTYKWNWEKEEYEVTKEEEKKGEEKAATAMTKPPIEAKIGEVTYRWDWQNGKWKRIKSLREQYMGKTPGKESKTGKEVIARMQAEGRIKEGQFEYQGKWYDIKDADMGHKIDAVTWWNKKGRFTGAKSKRVRRFMLSPYNYELQPSSINRSNGGKIGETYLPPVIIK